MTRYLGIGLILFSLVFASCTQETGEREGKEKAAVQRRVLILHSYNSDSKRVGEHNLSIKGVLDAKNVQYEFFYMDTQRNKDEAFIKQAAQAAKQRIDTYQPDVVICFDDNAFKYVIMPFYRDSHLPVVFAGIDWDISVYDAPYTNTTGMISVTLMDQLLELLTTYAPGSRVSWLGNDTLTTRKETHAYLKVMGLGMELHFVNGFDEWKEKFIQLQTTTDILIHSGTLTSLKGWETAKAAEFVSRNIKIPIGTVNKSIMDCAVVGLTVVPTEQGVWTATTALEILQGKTAGEIPVTHNKEGEVLLNLDLGERLNIRFSNKLLKNAVIFKSHE